MPAKSTGGKGQKPAKKKAAPKAAKKATTRPAATAAGKPAAKVKKKATTTKKRVAKAAGAGKPEPKAAPKKQVAGAATREMLRVRQVRSTIGRRADLRRTLVALGLKHHQDEVVVKQSPAIDGMLRKVRHLVRVSPEG